ncbi:MAG: MBL fold metallo-hydrolase, partial [Vicinamibacterales bacterium]
AKVSRNKKIYLVTTHAHAEHTSGMDAFPEDMTFVVARAQQAEMDAAGDRAFAGMAKLSPAIATMLQGAKLRKPGIVFEQEHVLDLGGVKARVIWMGPAHSKGDTVTVVEGEGVIFAGDIAPRQRFPSLYGDAKRVEFVKAMGRVEALNGRVIVPSHGPWGDNSIFAEQRKVLDEIAARVASLKGQGQPLDAVTKTVAAEFRARYPTWESAIPNEVEPIIRGVYAE